MTEHPMVSIDGVRKLYGIYTALNDVSLDILPGEFFSLLGPSGCGKTTLLRAIAGFETPSAGDIRIDGRSVISEPPNRRPTNMVFQNYAIFPHLNVEQNVAYGLRRLKLGNAEENRRVHLALEQVRLGHMGKRRAHELSGGQRQRVALARALVLKPKVLLLDEPLSALDKNLREEMQVELRSLQKEVGITFVLVTHDQYEAMALSDRIAVMFEGQVAQVAAAKDIYQRPRTRMVAHFLGGMNFLNGRITGRTFDRISVDVERLGMLTLRHPEEHASSGSTVTVGIRPEKLQVLSDRQNADFEITGHLLGRTYFGQSTQMSVGVDGLQQPLSVLSSKSDINEFPIGSTIRLGYDPEDMAVLIDDRRSTRQ
ncbi:MAG: transporter family protein [Rhizobium sp.]|nr:transporter family protein [Rhizobium sp.]